MWIKEKYFKFITAQIKNKCVDVSKIQPMT